MYWLYPLSFVHSHKTYFQLEWLALRLCLALRTDQASSFYILWEWGFPQWTYLYLPIFIPSPAYLSWLEPQFYESALWGWTDSVEGGAAEDFRLGCVCKQQRATWGCILCFCEKRLDYWWFIVFVLIDRRFWICVTLCFMFQTEKTREGKIAINAPSKALD